MSNSWWKSDWYGENINEKYGSKWDQENLDLQHKMGKGASGVGSEPDSSSEPSDYVTRREDAPHDRDSAATSSSGKAKTEEPREGSNYVEPSQGQRSMSQSPGDFFANPQSSWEQAAREPAERHSLEKEGADSRTYENTPYIEDYARKNPMGASGFQEPKTFDRFSGELTSFGDGIKQFGDRFFNDMNYNVGMLQRAIGDEEQTQRAIEGILPDLERFEQGGADAIRSEQERVSDWMGRSREALQGLDLSDPQMRRKGEQLEESLQGAKSRWEILDRMGREVESGVDPGDIRRRLEEYVRQGGPGERRMREAQLRNETYRPTKGWAKAAEVGGGILQQALPIAGAVIAPPLGVGLGIANVGAMGAQTHAQAQMEVDRYEREQGERVSTADRAKYVGVATGIDLLLQQAMQGRYLGNALAPARRALSKRMVGELMSDPALLQRTSPIAGAYKRQALNAALRGVGKDMALEGSTEGISDGVREAARGFYDAVNGMPDWREIASNAGDAALSGAAVGAVTGGLSRGVGRVTAGRQRANRNIASVATLNGVPVEVLGVGRYGNTTVRYPSGKVIDVSESLLDNYTSMRNDAYRRSMPQDRGATSSTPVDEAPVLRIEEMSLDFINHIEVPDGKGGMRRLTPMEKQREKEAALRRIREKYGVELPAETNQSSQKNELRTPIALPKAELEGRRRHVEKLAKELGVEVDIYDTQKEIPRAVKDKLIAGESYRAFYAPENGRISVILDRAKNYGELESAVLHEAVGHKGMRAILGKRADSYYDRIFSAMSPEDQQNYLIYNNGSPQLAAEEYLAEVAGGGIQNISFWQRAKAETREVLRDRLGMDLSISEKDYRYLLWKAKNSLQEGDSMESLLRKVQEENKRWNNR